MAATGKASTVRGGVFLRRGRLAAREPGGRVFNRTGPQRSRQNANLDTTAKDDSRSGHGLHHLDFSECITPANLGGWRAVRLERGNVQDGEFPRCLHIPSVRL